MCPQGYNVDRKYKTKMNENDEPVQDQLDTHSEDELSRLSTEAAHRLVSQEDLGRWEPVKTDDLDPKQPLTSRERRIIMEDAEGALKIKKHEDALHQQIDELEETREMQQGLAAHASHKLMEQASEDKLTGVMNRRAFQGRLEALARASENRGLLLGGIFIDLDGFKRVNDTQGHKRGDEALRMTVEELRRNTREGIDVVSRIGGDEFAVLINDPRVPEGVTNEEFMEKKASELKEAIADRFKRAGLPVDQLGLGASMGTGILQRDEAADAFLERLDSAMYQDKTENKARLADQGVTFEDNRLR